MEILGLARRTDFSLGISLAVVVTLTALILGLSIAWVSLQIWNRIASGNSNYQLGLLKEPSAFLLMGIRLGQIQGWKSFQVALVPACVKVLIVPGLVGIGTTLMCFSAEFRLALVLMSGMPTAFAGLILAEEYELDRELIASSIAITSVMLLVMIPFWLFWFGQS